MKSNFKSSTIVATILFLGLSLVATQEGHEGHETHSTKLKILTEETFFTNVMDPVTTSLVHGPWFIMFFAPWCGHCKRLMPIWDEFAESHGDHINVARVDCDDSNSKGLCSQFDVSGYPTVLYLRDGKVYRYRGERSLTGFLQFTHGGFEEAESDDLPRRLEGFEMYQKQF